MQLISFADVIRLIKKKDHQGEPIPFALKVVKYDRMRDKGGDLLVVDKAIFEYQKDKGKQQAASASSNKQPKHFENSTMNIQFLPSMQIRKIHPRLIVEFNGKQVFY